MGEAPISNKRKRGNPNQKTGLIGVYNHREKYRASTKYGGKTVSLGVFNTKEQAGIAYDRFVVDKSTEEVFFTMNYPKMSDQEREEALNVEEPVQQKRGNPNRKTGLIGVARAGNKKYQAYITYGGTRHYLGSFATKQQAGIAYDRAAIGNSTEEVSFTLNYPNMSDFAREEALNVEAPPTKKRERGSPNQTTGLIGVYTTGERYYAAVNYGGKKKHLGTFGTKEQAGIAYDRFVVDKSTEEVSFILNYPNGLPTIGTNKDGTAGTDLPTIKHDPKAEFFQSLTCNFFY